MSDRAAAGSRAGEGGGDNRAAGDTAVASPLSQSRMGHAVLADTAARPRRRRWIGVVGVLAGAIAMVGLAVLFARGGADEEGGGRASAPAVRTRPRGEVVASPAVAAVPPPRPVAPVPAPPAVSSPPADVGPAADAESPAAEVGEDAAEAFSEVRIELRGVPRGAVVRVDGERHAGTTVRRPRGTGEVRIEVLGRGFRPWERTVSLARDVEIEVRLEPAGGRPARPGVDARGATGLPAWRDDEE